MNHHQATVSPRLFNGRAILLGSFLGGPLITGMLTGYNLMILEKKTKAFWAVILGMALSVLLLSILILLPNKVYHRVPVIFIPILYTIFCYILYELFHRGEIVNYRINDGKFKPLWIVIPSGILGLLLNAGIVLLNMDYWGYHQKHMTFGPDQYEIRYSRNIPDDEVERIGSFLVGNDYFREDLSSLALLIDSKSHYTLKMVIVPELWNNQDLAMDFRFLEPVLNNSGFRKKIKLLLTDIYQDEEKEIY